MHERWGPLPARDLHGAHKPVRLQVGNILLVLAHADSVVKGAIGRRETLLALFGVMNKLDRRERALLKCLKCLRLLTFDPALLQPLQACPFSSLACRILPRNAILSSLRPAACQGSAAQAVCL